METFQCKYFSVKQSVNTMKVNIDAFLLAAWVELEAASSILDIGTGTGIIALIAAQRNSKAVVVGVEINVEGAEEAESNFSDSPFSDRMKCVTSSIQEFAQSGNVKFDVILTNPPFFSGGTFSNNINKTNVKHTVKLSHGDLIIAVKRLLSPNGRFSLILPFIEGERFIEMGIRNGLYPIRVTEVLMRPGKPVERLLITLGKVQSQDSINRDFLVMYTDGTDREYTDEYKKLTSEIYH